MKGERVKNNEKLEFSDIDEMTTGRLGEVEESVVMLPGR